MKELVRTNKKDNCIFHKCLSHETNECVYLKDVVEDLIHKVKFNRYNKE